MSDAFAKMLDDFEANAPKSGGDETFTSYFKNGETVFFPVMSGENVEDFLKIGWSNFNGKKSRRSIFYAFVFSAKDVGGLREGWRAGAIPVAMSFYSVGKPMLEQLKRGHELTTINPDGSVVWGSAFYVDRSGSGTDTEYNVGTLAKLPDGLPSSLAMPETSIADIAENFSNWQEENYQKSLGNVERPDADF